MNIDDILELESKGCFDYFFNESSKHEKGYGLIKDSTLKSTNHENVSSISSTGFGLCAMVIGIERRYITYDEGYFRVLNTLKSIYRNASNIKGFFNHFLMMDSGKTAWNSEVSIIDTSIFVMGAMVCSEYFGGEIKDYFEKIYKRIDWEFFRNKSTNRFYMGYDDKQDKYFGEWDNYAEQLMIYFLGVASPTHPINSDMFYNFIREKVSAFGMEFITSPFGSLFVHQFSHAFIDFRGKKDKLGIDYFENSKIATLVNREYCIERSNIFETYGENSWGITPCETPNGYVGSLGSKPSKLSTDDGTIALCGAVSSIVFTEEESINAVEYMYHNFRDKVFGKYGFKDSYNLDKGWFCDHEIGINKGITLLMIENYRTSIIWNLVSKNNYIKRAFNMLSIKD